jgi:hypothetical protein
MWGTAYSCDTISGTSANKIVYKVGAAGINSGGVTKPSLCLARAETLILLLILPIPDAMRHVVSSFVVW